MVYVFAVSDHLHISNFIHMKTAAYMEVCLQNILWWVELSSDASWPASTFPGSPLMLHTPHFALLLKPLKQHLFPLSQQPSNELWLLQVSSDISDAWQQCLKQPSRLVKILVTNSDVPIPGGKKQGTWGEPHNIQAILLYQLPFWAHHSPQISMCS